MGLSETAIDQIIKRWDKVISLARQVLAPFFPNAMLGPDSEPTLDTGQLLLFVLAIVGSAAASFLLLIVSRTTLGLGGARLGDVIGLLAGAAATLLCFRRAQQGRCHPLVIRCGRLLAFVVGALFATFMGPTLSPHSSWVSASLAVSLILVVAFPTDTSPRPRRGTRRRF